MSLVINSKFNFMSSNGPKLFLCKSFHLLLMTMENYTCLLSSVDCGFFLHFILVEFCTICVFWFCRDTIGIASAVAAMIGLSILLLLGVLDWNDCLNEKSAWDTLAWSATRVGMASQLTNLGIVNWMSDYVAHNLRSFSLSWPASLAVLQAAYFFIHYLFASQTGPVGALYSAFLAMHRAAGVPGILAALALGYNTNLFGAITHYSSGQAAVYYGGFSLSIMLVI